MDTTYTSEDFSADMEAAILLLLKVEATIREMKAAMPRDEEEPPPDETDTFNDSRYW